MRLESSKRDANMPSAEAESAGRFTIICPKCDRPLLTRREWVGGKVHCPHCNAPMGVPPARADGRPARAMVPGEGQPARPFDFACPRCASLLTSHAGLCGQMGRCPTCAARFVIPALDAYTGEPCRATLLDSNDQYPTPMHAYAASGQQAPRIHRLPDGTLQIECPGCEQRCGITANHCLHCGRPFPMEGVPTTARRPGGALATTSLVLGIISVPLFFALVPAGLAILCALLSRYHSVDRRLSGIAIAGLVLGGLSLALGLMVHLF